MSKISKEVYIVSGPLWYTLTLKSSRANIISNRPFYSDHSTYFWAQYGIKKTALAVKQERLGGLISGSYYLFKFIIFG